VVPLNRDQLWTASGQPRTRSLFVESCIQGDEPIMSLRGNVEGYECLRDYYVPMMARDPSGESFCEAVFGGDTRYWLRLKEASWMKPFLKEWDELADIKRKQIAFKAIIKEVEENGKSSFSAAKFLIDEPWKPNDKETKTTKQKTTTRARSVFDEDIDRLREEGLLQ
jgi:hypothetical protein